MDKEFNDIIKDQQGNIIALLPIDALKKLGKKLSPIGQEALEEIVERLNKEYFFAGEMLFESPAVLQEKFGDQLSLVGTILKRYGLDIGSAQNYNINAKLRELHETPLSSEHGTARRDKIREELSDIFGLNKNQDPLLEITRNGSLDGRSNFVVTFNINAIGHQFLEQQNLTSEEVQQLTGANLKRVIRRANLQLNGSSHPTDSDKAIELYDSDRSDTIELFDNTIKVTIPLTRKVNGAFQDGELNYDEITQAIMREVDLSIQMGISLKLG